MHSLCSSGPGLGPLRSLAPNTHFGFLQPLNTTQTIGNIQTVSRHNRTVLTYHNVSMIRLLSGRRFVSLVWCLRLKPRGGIRTQFFE